MSNPRRTYVEVNGRSVLIREEWRLNDRRHRLDGPAYQEWDIVNDQPVLNFEAWFLNGKYHRLAGPAYQEWDIVNDQHILTWESWYWNDKRHRLDGPALRVWDIVNDRPILSREEWHIRDKLTNPERLRSLVRKIEQWWLYHRARRYHAIEQLLLQGGMIVWPGFMGLLKGY